MHDLVLVLRSCIHLCNAVPGAVSAVNTSQVSDEVVLVDWDAPEEPNGILQRYVLVYREYDSSASDLEVNVTLPATSYNVSGLSESNNSQPAA